MIAIDSSSFISQSCIDHDVALVSRDDDFRHFEKLAGIKLLA